MGEEAGSPASDASHESVDADEANTSKVTASKDKACPYCHQKFTSSSLGRHLDQFISKKRSRDCGVASLAELPAMARRMATMKVP
jgi:hypothetical protein